MRSRAEEYRNSEFFLKKQAFIEAEVNKFRSKLDLPPLHPDDYKDTKEKHEKDNLTFKRTEQIEPHRIK